MTNDKFERGILTKADREYLRNPDEYSRQAAYNREQAIRERLQRAFRDFPLLVKALDDSALDDLLAPERERVELHDETTATESEISSEAITLPYAVAFLIRAALATDRHDPVPEVGVEGALSSFVLDAERGIEIWLNDRHELTGDVSVSVAVDDLQHADTLADDVAERDEPLTGYERIKTVSQLSRAGYSTEEIAELVGIGVDVVETDGSRDDYTDGTIGGDLPDGTGDE
jgi:hypothetical protein